MNVLCLPQSLAFWVWIAVSRQTRQVLGLAMGDHTDPMLALAWLNVPHGYRELPVYTVHWEAYQRLFASAQHQACDKGSGHTSIVEAHNT